MRKLKKKNLFILFPIVILTIIFLSSTYMHLKDNSHNKTPNSPYYSTLLGTWRVTKHIPSNITTTLSDSIISFCIGQKFTIEEDKITSRYATIYNPTINEGIMTAIDFSKKYNETFINLGISENNIKYIMISETNKANHSVTIFITNDKKIYALLSGALFELEKQ